MWWWYRWRARARLNTRLALWYHSEYAAPDIPADRRVAHMQTDRAEQALARLSRLGLITRADVASPALAHLEDLERVHPRSYIEQVTSPDVLGRIFGVPAAQVEVDALLMAQRRAVGGTIAAALAVVRGAVRVGFNLGGGFHHAAPTKGAGFCVFNDIAIAIALLRVRGFSQPIAIVDLDFHQGDGNLAAFADDPSVLVYSIHGAEWTDRKSPACRNYALRPGAGDREYLATMEDTLRPALLSHGTKLIFYVAGVDVLAGDQLGDFNLTARGVLTRDRRVIAAADLVGAPVVVTMAGGYSAGAWQCTANLIRWLLTGITHVDRSPAEKLRHRYEEVARRIDPWDLQRDDGLAITEEDLMPDRDRRPRSLLLDFYSMAGTELAFERYGLLDRLRERGLTDLRVVVNPEDPEAQVIRVEGAAADAPGATLLLLELVVSRRVIPAPSLLGGAPLPVLRIEWLLMQDPTRSFSPTRPRLPGQEFPGLGFAHEVHQLLVEMGKHLHIDGIVQRPAHYHNAVLAGREYHFLDPEAEGRFRGLRRVLSNVTLAEATNFVDQGRVVIGNGKRLVWEPAVQLLPAGERLASYFESDVWRERARRVGEELLAAGLRLQSG